MGRKLKREELVFDDIIEEIRVLVFGDYYEDEDGNYYEAWEEARYIGNPDVEHIDKVFESGGLDNYLFMEYIFKYKDKYYSIIRNEDSYGDSGFETDTLKEVFPKEKLITVYEGV